MTAGWTNIRPVTDARLERAVIDFFAQFPDDAPPAKLCPDCVGSGQIKSGGFAAPRLCRTCRGTGRIPVQR